MDTLMEVTREILAFRDERDWAQFHKPRQLAAALAVEAGELQEAMLWKTDLEVEALLADVAKRVLIEREVADVLIFALLLCHETHTDPISAIRGKLRENAEKYPVELARGKADKYPDLR